MISQYNEKDATEEAQVTFLLTKLEEIESPSPSRPLCSPVIKFWTIHIE